MIVGDKNYNLTPRFNYGLEIKDLDNEVVVAKITRAWGAIYDILRPIVTYIKAGETHGFRLTKHIECKPTKPFITAEPKYQQFADIPIAHMLVFQKSV